MAHRPNVGGDSDRRTLPPSTVSVGTYRDHPGVASYIGLMYEPSSAIRSQAAALVPTSDSSRPSTNAGRVTLETAPARVNRASTACRGAESPPETACAVAPILELLARGLIEPRLTRGDKLLHIGPAPAELLYLTQQAKPRQSRSGHQPGPCRSWPPATCALRRRRAAAARQAGRAGPLRSSIPTGPAARRGAWPRAPRPGAPCR